MTDIYTQTKFLDEALSSKIPLRQREWHIQHNTFTIPLCKTCQLIPVKWSIKNKTYSTYCSSKCAHQSLDVKLKTEQTCLSRYGAKTNLSTNETKSKIKQTCLEKYGVDNFSKTTDFKIAFKSTCLKKYGVDNPSKSLEIQQRIDQTHTNRYNRKRSSQVHIPLNIIDLKNDHNEMKRLFFDLKMPVSEIADLLNVNHSQLCVHFKTNLGIDISRHRVSTGERTLFEYIKSLNSSAYQSDRSIISPKELDIVVPDKKVAFEHNGLAWHTELRGKDKFYHKNKTLSALLAGYRLVHILDFEWKHKTELVKSRISSILGTNSKIFARKCSIRQLSSDEYMEFFRQTHIQGTVGCNICYGLIFQNEIVAAMSFGKPRYNKNFEIELLRYSTKLFTNVVGGASRLFNHFIKCHTPNSIISYCDLRWNTGKVYESIGFSFSKSTDPNYWYTSDYTNIEHRSKYQKHKLASLLSSFDPTLTEWTNMANHNYDRFWDCGDNVYVWYNKPFDTTA